MSVITTQKKELLDRVGELLGETRGVDFVIPEDSGYFSIEDDVVKKVRVLMRHASDLMQEVMECYDAETEIADPGEIEASDDESFLKEIGAQISSAMAVEEVSGLAWVSRGQLLDMAGELDRAISKRQIWKVASLADSGLRRVGRGLIAIESAIRECEGLPVQYLQWQNLDDSLEVRRIYGDLRRGILADGGDDPDDPPKGPELGTRLERAVERVARLRRHEIYPYLRIDDRLQIRRLHERILAWLNGARKDEAGAQLWSDLISFARLLGEVSRRQELREHDRLAINGLYRRFIEGGGLPEKLGVGQLSLLEPLLGLEDELDDIILHPDEHTGEDLREPLERLRRELGKPFESPPPVDFAASPAT